MSDAASESPPTPERATEPDVPPRRLPLLWTLLLLLLLPLIAVAIWLAGAYHQVDDRPRPANPPARKAMAP